MLSVRGAGGGYCLAREPQQITPGDVIKAVEGPSALTLLTETHPKSNQRSSLPSPLRSLCDRAAAALEKVMGDVTFADLADENGSTSTGELQEAGKCERIDDSTSM